jgi:hypothetical protein
VFSQCYFFLQILPFFEKHYALLNKFAGYFIWKTHSLRISRLTLMQPYKNGGLQYKDLKLQGQALRVNRLLQVICNFPHVFSYAYTQTVLANIDPVAPLNIQTWQHINPFFLDIYIEISYLLVAQISFDNYTTKIIYQTLFQRCVCHTPNIELKNPQYNWTGIYGNLYSIRYCTQGYDHWYRLIHNQIATKDRLTNLGILSDSQCLDCGINDDLKHRITQCNSNHMIWKQYTRMVALLLHTSAPNIQFETLIQFPEYKYFPPRKKIHVMVDCSNPRFSTSVFELE